MSDEEFERNVEAAVSAIAQSNREAEAASRAAELDKPAPNSSEVTPRNSGEGERYPRRKDAATSGEEDNAPVTGLLRTIQKPLSTIGRIFSDEPDSPPAPERRVQQATGPPPVTASRPSPGPYPPPGSNSEERRLVDQSRRSAASRHATSYEAEEAAARQASAEAAEARRIQRAEHNDVVE